MNILGKLLCSLPKWIGGGHKRGKRVPTPEHVQLSDSIVGVQMADFRCPRCGATWARKASVKKAAA